MDLDMDGDHDANTNVKYLLANKILNTRVYFA